MTPGRTRRVCEAIRWEGHGRPRPAERGGEKPKEKRAASRTRPDGFEPSTCGLEDRCSIQLSYGRHEEEGSNRRQVVEGRRSLSVRSACIRDSSGASGLHRLVQQAIGRRFQSPSSARHFSQCRARRGPVQRLFSPRPARCSCARWHHPRTWHDLKTQWRAERGLGLFPTRLREREILFFGLGTRTPTRIPKRPRITIKLLATKMSLVASKRAAIARAKAQPVHGSVPKDASRNDTEHRVPHPTHLGISPHLEHAKVNRNERKAIARKGCAPFTTFSPLSIAPSAVGLFFTAC